MSAESYNIVNLGKYVHVYQAVDPDGYIIMYIKEIANGHSICDVTDDR